MRYFRTDCVFSDAEVGDPDQRGREFGKGRVEAEGRAMAQEMKGGDMRKGKRTRWKGGRKDRGKEGTDGR